MALAGTAQVLSGGPLRLWFLHQLRPDDCAYNLVTAVRITGPLSVSALDAACTRLLRQHEGLCSTFELVHSAPVQRFGRAGVPATRIVDLCGLPEPSREPAEAEVLAELGATPFDLLSGPVAHWTLLRRSGEENVLALAVHHIVFDGGSLAVLGAGLERFYDAYRAGTPAPVPAAGPDRGGDGDGDGDEAYWVETLTGAPVRLDILPPPESRPEASARAVTTITSRLGPDRVRALRGLAAANRSTPFTVLFGIFAGLVARYSAVTDLVIGTPLSSREPSSGAIGFAVNMVPLRLHTDPTTTCVDAMNLVRDAMLDGLMHGPVGFERLVDAIGPPRELTTTPLFQVVFAHQEAPPAPRLPGLRTELVPLGPGAAKYPITVVATETPSEVELAVQVDRDTADPETVELFAANLDLLTAGALDRPDIPLTQLPILGAVDGIGRADAARDGRETAVSGARGTAGRAPFTAAEREVADALVAVSAVSGPSSNVDVDSTFFDLGVTSLSLLRLHAELTSTVDPDVTLADLFRFPTVTALAGFIDTHRAEARQVDTQHPPGPQDLLEASGRGARRRAVVSGRRRG